MPAALASASLLALLCGAAPAPTAVELAEKEIRLALAAPGDVDQALEHLRRKLGPIERRDPALANALAREIAWNLRDKRELPKWKGASFALELEDVRRRVIDYEAFKQDAFITSGVFPKRYFGYVDERWDTSAHERTLKRVVRGAVDVVNAHQSERKSPVRITDAEVAVTFIAEGGALLLRERQSELDRIHPIAGVGLDDIAIGFAREAKLVRRLDTALGTKLGTLVEGTGASARLTRYMTFEEAILGTAVMWLYEKELCARKLGNEGRTPLHERPEDAQFILGSLVYNSGIAFSDERVELIRTFRTGDYLAEVSRASAQKRWPLPVEDVRAARHRLRSGEGYPDQPTSWSAVYHVLQRYGAYVALRRFTDAFDGRGRFR